MSYVVILELLWAISQNAILRHLLNQPKMNIFESKIVLDFTQIRGGGNFPKIVLENMQNKSMFEFSECAYVT